MYFSIYAETNGEVSLIDEAGEYNPAYAVKDPVVKQEANKAGTLEFTIHPLHPYFNQFIKMKTKMWVIQDGLCIFYGRVLYTQMDMSGSKKVYCEGALSYLLDTLASKERALIIQRLLASDQVDEDWRISVRDFTKFDLSVADFYKLLIALHNSQVTDESSRDKQFQVDPTHIGFVGNSEKYNFEIDGMTNLADFVLDTLVEQVGGYITVRPVFGSDPTPTLYIDWEKIPDSVENFQSVEFGKNLIKFDADESGAELFTIFVPTGKPTDSSVKDVHLYDIENWDDPSVLAKHPKHFYFNKRTANNHEDIYTEPTGDPDEVEVNINANPNQNVLTNEIQIATGIAKYGKIYKAYDIENVNAGDALYNLAIDKVIKLYDPEPAQVTVTALDLYKMGYADQSPIRYGAYLTVSSSPHGLDRRMLCCQVEHHLREPQSTTYTLTSDLNEKGDGVPIFSQDTSKAKGGGGGSGGSSSGGSISSKTTSAEKETKKEEKKTKNLVLTLEKNQQGMTIEQYETKNRLELVGDSIGFYTQEDGKGASSELNLLKDQLMLWVDEGGKERSVIDLLKDYMGFTIMKDEQGIPKKAVDDEGNPNPDYLKAIKAQISLNENLISMVVNPADGSTPASIKIGAIVDDLNTSSGVLINAGKIKLSGSGSSITLGDKIDVLGSMDINGGSLEVNKEVSAVDFMIRSGEDYESVGEQLSALFEMDPITSITLTPPPSGSNLYTLEWTSASGDKDESVTFSRAITSWTTEWSNGAIVMTATPQNQSNSYTPSLGLFGTTQYPSFTADIYESVQSGTPISRKQVSGYLIETVNGTSSHVDVSKNSDGSGAAVARISTANTWNSGRNTGWDSCYNSIDITGPTAGQIDYGASATVVVKATDKGGVERTLFNRTYTSKADRYSIGKQDGIDETMAKIVAKSSTITANGTYTASTDNLLGYSSVVVNVSGTNYEASDVTLSDGTAGTPTVNQSDNNWYAPVDVTKTLGSTQDTDTINVNVQSAINVGVQAGWDSAKGVSSLPQAKESGWDSYIDVSIPGSSVGATYADTFTMTGDGRYVYLQNSDGDNVARFNNSLSITSLTPNRLQPTGMTVSRTVTAQTYDQYMVVYLNINGISQVVKYLVKINAKT